MGSPDPFGFCLLPFLSFFPLSTYSLFVLRSTSPRLYFYSCNGQPLRPLHLVPATARTRLRTLRPPSFSLLPPLFTQRSPRNCCELLVFILFSFASSFSFHPYLPSFTSRSTDYYPHSPLLRPSPTLLARHVGENDIVQVGGVG